MKVRKSKNSRQHRKNEKSEGLMKELLSIVMIKVALLNNNNKTIEEAIEEVREEKKNMMTLRVLRIG